MYLRDRWLTRGLIAFAGTMVVGAGLMLGGVGASTASAALSPRINGGVEDGTFSATCLRGRSATPDTSVLAAATYRNRLGSVVRILVPYNIATRPSSNEFKCFNTYLNDAGAYGAVVEVSLDRLGFRARAPRLATYTKDVEALAKAAAGRISYLTAWNEPNNRAYLPGFAAAREAGEYFVAANKSFPGEVVAGDFASGVSPSFLNRYVRALGDVHPAIWAIHPYTDVTNFQYYEHAHLTPSRAAAKAAAGSKLLQFARYLSAHGYGPSTSIWINEIYVDHTADKNPPTGIAGKKGSTIFSTENQANAALFLSGGLGADSLPGVLAGKNLPQLTLYIYLRAWDAGTDQQLPDADVLEVHFPDCLYYTLAGHKTTPAPQCS
jgi:hypothetical protein